MSTMTTQSQSCGARTLRPGALKRLAQAGFWFFLAKGLLWLIIPIGLHLFASF